MHDPLWLGTEATRAWDADELERSEEAMHEVLYCAGHLGRSDGPPVMPWELRSEDE